jgi:hypothetical protein
LQAILGGNEFNEISLPFYEAFVTKVVGGGGKKVLKFQWRIANVGHAITNSDSPKLRFVIIIVIIRIIESVDPPPLKEGEKNSSHGGGEPIRSRGCVETGASTKEIPVAVACLQVAAPFAA